MKASLGVAIRAAVDSQIEGLKAEILELEAYKETLPGGEEAEEVSKAKGKKLTEEEIARRKKQSAKMKKMWKAKKKAAAEAAGGTDSPTEGLDPELAAIIEGDNKLGAGDDGES